MTIEEFIGKNIMYDPEGQLIFREDPKVGLAILLELRSWAGVQKLFTREDGSTDFEAASEFHDELGEWVVQAVKEKLDAKTKNKRFIRFLKERRRLASSRSTEIVYILVEEEFKKRIKKT